MEQIPMYGDERTLAFCAFCGGKTGTRDHCPSRVFLDKLYPKSLPVVFACLDCNAGFSEDGGVSPNRRKFRRILSKCPQPLFKNNLP